MASTGHRKRNSVITVLSHSHLVQHSSLHSVYSSTGDEVLKKRKNECVKRLTHFTDRNVILKFSFSKAAASYLHQNRSENPQHGDLEDSDIHHGEVCNQKNTSQIVKRRKMPFSLSVQLRAKLLVSTKAHYLFSVFSNNLIILMTSAGKLLVLLRPVS